MNSSTGEQVTFPAPNGSPWKQSLTEQGWWWCSELRSVLQCRGLRGTEIAVSWAMTVVFKANYHCIQPYPGMQSSTCDDSISLATHGTPIKMVVKQLLQWASAVFPQNYQPSGSTAVRWLTIRDPLQRTIDLHSLHQEAQFLGHLLLQESVQTLQEALERHPLRVRLETGLLMEVRNLTIRRKNCNDRAGRERLSLRS